MANYLWPELFDLLRKACKFINKWESKLPSDLPDAVKAWIAATKAACAVLDAYDLTHPGGKLSDNP